MKRSELPLLPDSAEQAASSNRPSLTLPTSFALGNSSLDSAATFFLQKEKVLTTVCLTDSSCVSSGAAGKLMRKRHYINMAVAVKGDLL